MKVRQRFVVPLWMLLGCWLPSHVAADSPISFNRDIRSILSENCFECHGPDEGTREAELRMDVREDAVAALSPGKLDESEVWSRVTSDDGDLRMPPATSKKQLTPAQLSLLRAWIEQGAIYERHWSLEPVSRPPLPAVKQPATANNSLDRFVLARLDTKDIAPAPEADRATLIRRLYLDLLGVTPEPEDVDEFLADTRPDAYEQLVDRLLANPHFGERWGRYWLDQARYADSHGYTNDNARTMWPYRDWVIGAFNRDLAFDQFTIEQLAGDLLPETRRDQIVATGFHRNTLINTEGGTKADQFRDEQVKDRVDTTGVVWMGLTVGCAKCHSHKYDPIEQREYYGLYAFFNSTEDRNSVAPTIQVPTAIQSAQLQSWQVRIDELKSLLAKPDPDKARRRAAWEAALIEQAAGDSTWHVVEANATSRHGATFRQLDDKSLLAEGTNLPHDVYTVRFPSPTGKLAALRLELLTHESLPQNGPGRASNGNIVLSDLRLLGPDGKPLAFARASADHSQKSYDIAGAIDADPKSGWAINGSPEGGANHNRVATLVLAAPLQLDAEQPCQIVMTFNNGNAIYNLGRFRFSTSSTPPVDAARRALIDIAAIPAAKRTKDQQAKLEDAFTREDPRTGPWRGELASIEAARDRVNKQVPTTMIFRELGQPRETHLQIRGDFLRPGDSLDASVPAALPQMPATQERQTRLEFARWLVSREHPLTSRVRANRIWMRLFGRGLVETENDFGTQGSLPSHPDLLDWLADEMQRRDWSQKQFIREIVTSATYRQSSNARPELNDAANRLLARQSRLRVEAEVVRDLGLSASGLLSRKIGGASVYPPQPDGVYAFTQVRKKWTTSRGADRYRRGLYTFFWRSAPHPMLTTFDAPKFNQTCTRRDRSNTPLQSLTVANDEAMFEMTRALARRVLVERPTQDDGARLTRLFRLCFSRHPESAELAALTGYLTSERRRLASNADAAIAIAGDVEQAAWTAVARVLINLDEFITRE